MSSERPISQARSLHETVPLSWEGQSFWFSLGLQQCEWLRAKYFTQCRDSKLPYTVQCLTKYQFSVWSVRLTHRVIKIYFYFICLCVLPVGKQSPNACLVSVSNGSPRCPGTGVGLLWVAVLGLVTEFLLWKNSNESSLHFKHCEF